MVDCTREDIRYLLPELVHDQLGPAERARVEQHLAECADCAAELELLGSLRATAFATPELDIDRIAAAVRASMAGSAAPGADDLIGAGVAANDDIPQGDVSAADVVSIDEARRRLASGAGAVASDERSAARTRREAGRTKRSPAGAGIPQSWRIAAVIALVAAGAGGYALTSGDGLPLHRPMEQATVAVSEPAAPAAAPSADAGRSAAKPAAPLMASGAAGAADSEAGLAAPPATTPLLGDAVNELSESDMQALLQSVDELEAMPDLEPHQLPLLASVVEGAL
jgi:hypothetical protein